MFLIEWIFRLVSPVYSTAFFITEASPMTTGLHLSYMSLLFKALRDISGPILAGSPIVIPIIGSLFNFFTFLI